MHSVTRTIFPMFALIVLHRMILLIRFCKLLTRVVILAVDKSFIKRIWIWWWWWWYCLGARASSASIARHLWCLQSREVGGMKYQRIGLLCLGNLSRGEMSGSQCNVTCGFRDPQLPSAGYVRSRIVYEGESRPADIAAKENAWHA